MEIKTQVRQLVTSLLRQRGDVSTFQDSDSLVMSGRLESIAVMQIVTFLEQTFRIDFARIGFDPSDFDSVDSIIAVVTREARHA